MGKEGNGDKEQEDLVGCCGPDSISGLIGENIDTAHDEEGSTEIDGKRDGYISK